jgi:ABC-type Fe3+/spermidine/putrescine transport system ATPase subunit
MPAELSAKLVADLGAFTLDVAFEASVGVTVLFGPSGSGKTSTLRCLAGLTPLRAGFVKFEGKDLTSLPPEQRGLGYVFQSAALFPHLTVEQNVQFGAAPDDAARWLNRLRLEPLARRKPQTLSGGEAQRVALARTLARGPKLLLLDEPFSSLDATLRDELVLELKSLVESERLVTLLVTHARAEAERLDARFLHLHAGRLTP